MPALETQTTSPARGDTDWLARGQSREAEGTPLALADAVACYDRAIAMLQTIAPQHAATTRRLAVAWMNRGNALQKQTGRALDAVCAYDRALALFTLITPSDDRVTNSVGAAWLNRGHALLQLTGRDHQLNAIASTEQAVGILGRLPVNDNLNYRLNLAGAQVNLAQALLRLPPSEPWPAACAAADAALRLCAGHEAQRAGFAEAGLQARRACCEIIGRWLVAESDPARAAALCAAASDAVDTGLALAWHWEAIGVPRFRPLATRLFRFGCAYYRRHQPHFLAEFVRENLHPRHHAGACPGIPEWQPIARHALAATRTDLRTRHPHHAGEPATARRLQALRDIDLALQTSLAPTPVAAAS